MTRVTWRNRKHTKTPSKAFDVSDVRRVTTDVLLVQVNDAANEASASGALKTID